MPRAWDDAEVERFEVPLAAVERSPEYPAAEEYYRYAVRPVYRGYPIYLPGKELEGYLDSLKQRDPEILFDVSKLQTESDWIGAGEHVFDAPVVFRGSTHRTHELFAIRSTTKTSTCGLLATEFIPMRSM